MTTSEGPRDDAGVHQVFVPGRLCVLGEHTDWAAGYRDQNRAIPPGMAIVATTREGLHARVIPRKDGRLVFKAACPNPSTSNQHSSCSSDNAGGGEPAAAAVPGSDGAAGSVDPVRTLDVAMTGEGLEGVIAGKGFFMYVAGTALVVCSRFGLFSPTSTSTSTLTAAVRKQDANATGGSGAHGVTIDNHLTTLPLKKGLSSSAAVCVLVVRALCLTYGLELSTPQVMELAHLGEARAGSKCGRMDQCCALGANHVAAMFFDGDDVQIYEIAPPERGIFLVVADLNGSKDTVTMLACLNNCFPHAKDEAEEGVHRYMRDNGRLAWKAVSAIEQGDARELGRAMAAAQTSFDECAIPICPSEFSSPLLHKVMSEERVKALTWGVKGVGCQGDGSVQMLARGAQEQEELIHVLNEMGMSGVLPVTVIRSSDSNNDASPAASAASTPAVAVLGDGGELTNGEKHAPTPQPRGMLHTRRVKSAVIVAAGLSTRMFPASAVVKKELFPIVDYDGVCKPVILAIMEGLVESGIERIVVVVQEKDIPIFDAFSSMKAVEKHKHRLKPAQRAYCARIEALRPRIKYAIQEQQEGFGHAVFCARDALLGAGGESEEEDSSFMLVLGDHLYRRGAGTTYACAGQLIHAFLEHGEAGKPAIGLKVMGESSVSPYGVAAGACISHPSPHIAERWQRATTTPSTAENGAPTKASSATATAPPQEPLPLGGRVYRLTKFAEKPTAEFAREKLVTPGLGRGDGGEGKHLVVFGQYILPARRTFDVLAEDIRLDRRERGEFQLTSVLDRMRQQDDGMLGCIIHGDALDMGIPAPYVETMSAFSKPHRV